MRFLEKLIRPWITQMSSEVPCKCFRSSVHSLKWTKRMQRECATLHSGHWPGFLSAGSKISKGKAHIALGCQSEKWKSPSALVHSWRTTLKSQELSSASVGDSSRDLREANYPSRLLAWFPGHPLGCCLIGPSGPYSDGSRSFFWFFSSIYYLCSRQDDRGEKVLL